MKIILVVCILICFARSDILPDYISELICHRSNPNYTKCIKENFGKEGRSIIKKGIPELNFPSLDPLKVPLVTVNRTYNNLFSVKGTIKNCIGVGGADVIIERMKINPVTLAGQFRLYFPLIQIDVDYDGAGQLLSMPLKSKGHFSGNFSNIQVFIKANLKPIKKTNGVSHFAVDKLSLKLTVGDGRIKLTADHPDMQFEADIVNNVFNEDPVRVLEILNPLITETTTESVKRALTEVFDTIPAKELLPE